MKSVEVLVTQSCSTLCDPMDCSPPVSSVHGIFQARILEWGAIPFSRGSSWSRNRTQVHPHCRQILYLLSHQGSPDNHNLKQILQFEEDAKSGGAGGKELTGQWRRLKRCRFDPWVRKITWRRKWQPPAVFLLGESHGQRSLTGYSTKDYKELDTTGAT